MPIEIAIALYDRFTALDCVGPYDVLSRLPGARLRWLAREAGPVQADAGLVILAEDSFSACTDPDVVLVPGGMRLPTPDDDPELFDWIGRVHDRTTWTTAVCSGTLVLAQLGLLAGREAATHWSEHASLVALGARLSDQRVVMLDGIATAAGVSAGIDLALRLAERLSDRETAAAIELAIEYDPQPPFGTGDARRASESLRQLATQRLEESIVTERRAAP